MKKFKDRFQYLIDKKNITQSKIALVLGVNEARISDWITGKVKAPRRTTLVKISSFFECDLNWLATGEGEPYPKPSNRIINGNDQIFSVYGNVNGRPSITTDHSRGSITGGSIKGDVRIRTQGDNNCPNPEKPEPSLSPDLQYMLKLIDKFNNKDEIIDGIISDLLMKLRE